ncbi:MAG: tetratricopeptide repeat protein [Planctomycetota bacterium]
MAARVNVKFVIILSVVLVALMAAVVFAAMKVVLQSGEDYAATAAELENAGLYEESAKSWERAVGHDRTRLDWLEGWKRTLERIDHSTDAEYIADRRMHQGILREMAEVKGPELAAHREYLDDLTYGIRAGGARIEDYNFVAAEVERTLLSFPESMPAERGQIRRYRGIVGAAALSRGAQLADDQLDLLQADLEAAISGDPGDEDALAALVQIIASLADDARRDGRIAESDETWQRLTSRVDAFVEANPDSIRGRVFQTNIRLATRVREIDDQQLFGADLSLARVEAATSLADTSESIYRDYMAAEPRHTGYIAATELTGLLRRTLTETAGDRAIDVWNRTLELHPDDVLVMQSRAAFLSSISRHEEAIEAFETIRDLPRPPISPEGQLLLLLQQNANVAIGSAAYEQWATRIANAERLERGSEARASMAEAAQRALQVARESRDRATEILAEDEPNLILLNAKIAFAEGEIRTADVLVRRYNETGGELDPEGLRLGAQVAQRLNNVGEQARLLSRLLEVSNTDVRAMLELAEVQLNLRNYEDAERLLTLASELRPDLDVIGDRLDMIGALLGKSEVEDPFEAAIIEAQRASDAGNIPQAIETLEASLRDNPTPDHIRVHIVLANALLRAGDIERAGEIADAGLGIDPGSTSLQIIKRQAEVGDDIDTADRIIDSIENLSETQRNLRKHALRLAQGEIEAAAPFLDAALAESPEDADVLLAAFEYALRTGETDDARAILAQTQGRDIDGANGLTLRAKIEIAEGRFEEAERTLAAAVERGSLNAETLSLLGRVQTLRGDQSAATESFRRARDIRPNDVGYTNNYIRSLAGSGRDSLALDVARQSLDIGRNNDEFMSLWLLLEGTVGSKQVAYDERVAISETRPEDDANQAALIRLCLDLRRFDEARERLDEARAETDSLVLCRLDALWHLQRGDLRAAIDQYNKFLISDAEGANTAAAYVAFGTFLIENGQLDNGLTTLRQGRRLQSPGNPVVDVELARRLFNAQRYADAADVLEDVVNNAAPDAPAAAQSNGLLIETYTRMSEWDAAQARLDALSDEERDTLTMRLLEVEVLRGRGEMEPARTKLDQTISSYPNEPMPYIRRASMLMADQALMQDAIEDLSRAIELDPSNSNAFRLRAICNTRLGRDAAAADDIAATARARPFDDQMRVGAAQRLIEMGRDDLAADVIDEGLERQAGNLRILFNAGQIFAAADSHARAVQYLQDAWDQSKEPAIAELLVRSMLELPRPDIRQARQVVTHPELDGSSPGVLLIRARVESADENWSAAESLLTDVYREHRDNPQVLFTWSAGLVNMLERDRAIDYLRRLDASQTLSPWGRFMQARVLSQDESGRSEAAELLSGLKATDQPPNLRVAALRLSSLVNYEAERFEAATEDIRAALDIAPDDPELNNNIAYIMAVELGRAAEALPFSQKAVERAPENRGFLDTLGTVYIEAGEPDKAIAPLERALTVATTDTDRAPVLVNLARARLDAGNPPGAADAADEARRIIEALDDPDERTQAKLNSVLEDIANAR